MRFTNYWGLVERIFTVRCYDGRTGKGSIGALKIPVSNQMINNIDGEGVTALRFLNDGLRMVVGTSFGQCSIYDLRKPDALLIKDHQYQYPINSLCPLPNNRILSTDKKIIKIWDTETGKKFL